MKSSGRYSRYPAVNRDIAPTPRAERFGGPPVVTPELVAEPVVAPVEETPVAFVPPPVVEVAAPVIYEMPDGTPDLSSMAAPDVLSWVGADEVRREVALANELAGRQRKGLVAALTK